MADRADRLAGAGEGAHEIGGVLDDPELVGIGHAARQHQGVIVAGLRFAQHPVDPDLLARGQVVEALDLALLGGDDLDLGAFLLERLQRLGELDLFEAVGGQDGDLLALELSGHSLASFDACRREAAPARPFQGSRVEHPARRGGCLPLAELVRPAHRRPTMKPLRVGR